MMGGDPKEQDQQPDATRMSVLRVMKQWERWSKSSDISEGNDSTRNTSLGVGAVARSYIEEESPVSSDAMMSDAVMRVQLMNLSLPSTKRDSMTHERCRSFQQFTLLGINPLSFDESDIYDSGSSFLDPFSTKNITPLDQFPTTHDSSVIDSEALAAFCFSNGLRLRLIPKCALEGARRLGWIGPGSDHYQLQGVSLFNLISGDRVFTYINHLYLVKFTDFSGALSHGIAITIHEELVGRHARNIQYFLECHLKRRRYRGIISRWLTKRLFIGTEFRRKSTSKQRVRRQTDSLGAINSSFRGAMDRMISRRRISNSGRDLGSSQSSGLTEYDSDDNHSEQVNVSSVSENARRLGREAFRAMIDVEDEGYICIVEKSYVMTGTPLEDQSLFFCALQNLINMERLVRIQFIAMWILFIYSFIFVTHVYSDEREWLHNNSQQQTKYYVRRGKRKRA
jgi:hypothetical protein